ncbi:glycerophosphodiester phosphodiesterase family protein [Sphingobacterium rhinopitheci]|uniref:glycerophosphodiester phosphodiesterase family protein n=1 Tax=Sphingobacterium rhinopitheci TaxID=2781960 RepID=UPI001F52AF37|nr:glycerophosphodiester phosphodiesterase family protein [Sphingobacterium rhinopitheci]MCI0920277.1 glycerophosphodiester phosphodiesterase family protein [Sphingobacterium rhinopitheci]
MYRKIPQYVFLVIGISFIVGIVGCFNDVSTANNNSNKSKKDIFQNGNFKLNTVEDLYQLLTFDDNRYPLISAHRGGASKGYPENAIETFQNVANHLPVIIECDIRLSKDSILVLMHDETLDRTTTGTGKVSDYTWEELKRLQLKDPYGKVTNYKIPTLQQALLWGKNKVVYTLDVKKDVPYNLLSNVIEKANAEHYAVVITYSANQARALYSINPELVISASIQSDKDLRRLTEFGIPDNRLIAFVGTSLPDDDLVVLLHSHGIKTIVGTLGNLDKKAQADGYQLYADFIDKGADVISTDYPLEAKKALDYYIRKRKLSSPYINN